MLMLFELQTRARIVANESYDRVLLGSALAISSRVFIVGDELDVDIPYVALEMLSSEAQDRVFYQVTAAGGQFLTGYDDLPPIPPNIKINSEQPVFYDAVYHGEKIRIGAVNRYVASPRLSTRFTVKVAETTDARSALIQEMLAGAVVRQLALIFVAGLILWFGVSWGLKPLLRLQAALQRRSPKDLRPIEHKVPAEVQQLVDAINDLMARLSQNIETTHRFTSNAAHQLRTPLAAIQMQTELALKTSSQEDLQNRLEFLRQSTRQSTRLVNQLLSLAKATPDETATDFEEINLVALCQSLTSKLVPAALDKKIDLGFEDQSDAPIILGHQDLVEEAVKNLVENAIAYCPEGSEITVRIKQNDTDAIIEVEDTGLGIFEDQQEKIFERFNRGNRSDGDGCGLGLPIVKEIIERHKGNIVLTKSSKKGTLFALFLPIA